MPRARQAPDGGKEGGSQATNLSVINRRLLLAPSLPMDKRHWDEDENVKKLLPTLDIGSHINAGAEPPPTAGAQRTLLVVGSSALFGTARVSRAALSPYPMAPGT